MDGAVVAEEGAEHKPRSGRGASEDEDAGNDRAGVFCCQDCGEAFRKETAFLEHRRQHPQGNMYLHDPLDGSHGAGRDGGAAHFCSLCSLSFVERSDFHLHLEKSHGQTSRKEPVAQMNSGMTKLDTYKCLDCGKCYGVIGHFLNHQRSHRQASKSLFHDLEHLKKKSFQCESCGRTYSRASALDAHRRCHEEKLIKSRNRSTADPFHTEESVVAAKPHENQAEDTPEKLFKCSCGKAFSALMRLKTHQRFSRNSQCSPEEMKEKPKKSCSEFYCSECNKAFSGHIALINHQRWHANHSQTSAQRFPCEECGKVFMTLTFYYRHQRTAHSDETPAKSFLHQVCQLQKKAFECQHCGLKFSRASALHSHQLHHTDVFREMEKEAQKPISLLPQQKSLESERTETELLVEKVAPSSVAEEDSQVNESDEDAESYEPGDFNVQVISASESEDEAVQDLNPDLELLCESDQEGRDDGDSVASPGLVSKPDMDLKIVQVDLEQADEQSALLASEAEREAAGERHDCPECYRWFSSASSLRVHRMWHGVHKRRRQTQGQSAAVYTCDTCGHEAGSYAEHRGHIQQHEAQDAEGLEKRNLTCGECGKCFSRLSALVSHQLHHPKRKQFQCPDCMMSYLHAASLFNHMKSCSAQKKENISVKKEYNPKKTLLGPKIYHCEHCGKGFWSLGAYSHHKQNPTECADLRLRKGVTGSLRSVNGQPRSGVKVACPVCGRKFRHRGIMALHMRKHENGNHKCELCGRSFRLFSSLLRHQVVHSDQLLPPPVKSFQHQVEQVKKNTYSCPDCAKLFSRAKALQFHMKSHGYETGRSPSSPGSAVALEERQCATCLAHFNNKASLRAHQKLCVKRSSRVVDRKTETSQNNPPLPYKLLEDGEDVRPPGGSGPAMLTASVQDEAGRGALKAEDEADAADSKYKCKECDRSFSVVGALNFHKRIHSEGYKAVAKAAAPVSVTPSKAKDEEPSKGPFHCSQCGRRFTSNSALGSHKRWHKEKKLARSSLKCDDFKPAGCEAEDGPFQCGTCDKRFFNRCVLQRHRTFNSQCQTRTEPEPDSGEGAERQFSCRERKEIFVQGSTLAARYEGERGESGGVADHQNHRDPERDDVKFKESEATPSTLEGRAHQCPLCPMTFAKARGLRAHKWQAHSNSTKGKILVPLSPVKASVATSSEVRNTATNAAVMSSSHVAKKNSPVARGKTSRVSCLDCGKPCSSVGALLHHKKACLEVKQESKQEAAEVSPPPGRLAEHTAKCLFKCDKCGKAFQTEDQLSGHKAKAKSRPYCCALCCHGFWTENQLQQHLAWHDEVRCRLPNEVRHRLSAALTPRLLKPNMGKPFPSSPPNRANKANAEGQSQSGHKCQHCGKAFLSPTALQKHETQHCNDDSYHCSICPRTFREIQELIDHHQECISGYKRQGDATGLTCFECGTTFFQETDLHQHYVEHARGVL